MSDPADPPADATPTGRDGRSTRWDPHRRARRQAIVDAAIEAIGSSGPDALTAQIAQVAGVPRTHVYRHFDGKAALDRAVCGQVAVLLGRRLRDALGVGGSPRAIIRSAVGEHLRWVEEHPNLYRFLAQHAWAVDGADGVHETTATADAKAVFADELSSLIRAYLVALGAAQDPDPRTVIGVVGLVDAVAAWWLDHREPARDEVADELAEQVWLLLERSAARLGIRLDPDQPLPPPAG